MTNETLERLLTGEFREVGEWSLNGDKLNCSISGRISDAVYVFAVNELPMYVGECKGMDDLRTRMRSYNSGDLRNSTYIYVGKALRDCLARGEKVVVWASTKKGLHKQFFIRNLQTLTKWNRKHYEVEPHVDARAKLERTNLPESHKSQRAEPLSRNPPWARDELILALELYFRVNPLHVSEKNPEIQNLSRLLNELPIHAERPDRPAFRSPNSVYMKLCNYLRFDPSYDGKGLTQGGKEETVVWNEFAGDIDRLKCTADAIRLAAPAITTQEVLSEAASEEEEFTEGRILTAMHKLRERNTALVRKKKASILRSTGKLACEACGFDFEASYGPLGAGFIECHHKVPLWSLKASARIKLTDLVLVCSNCHRVFHRSKPMISLDELKAVFRR